MENANQERRGREEGGALRLVRRDAAAGGLCHPLCASLACHSDLFPPFSKNPCPGWRTGGLALAQMTPPLPFRKCQLFPSLFFLFFYLAPRRCCRCCSCWLLPGRGNPPPSSSALPLALPCPARGGGLARRLHCSNEAARIGPPRLRSDALGLQRRPNPRGGAREAPAACARAACQAGGHLGPRTRQFQRKKSPPPNPARDSGAGANACPSR